MVNTVSIMTHCRGERKLTISILLSDLGSDEEHVALLVESRRFGLFRRKDDLLAEGVSAVFGLADGEADLLALCFHGERFTPADTATWLVERGFTSLLFIPILGTDSQGMTGPDSDLTTYRGRRRLEGMPFM